MKYPKVDSDDARLLARSLGLLLNQAAVYGPVHNVTRSATARVYQELNRCLHKYAFLEFSVKSNLICINGSSEELDSALSANLVRRFAQLDISGLLFTLPMPQREFEKVVNILSMPIAQITESSGVGRLFEREAIQSASVVRVHYQRVKGESGEEDEISLTAPNRGWTATDESVRPSAMGTGGSPGMVFDLSEDIAEGDLFFSSAGLTSSGEARADELRRRKEQASRLAELLRATAESLEANTEENPKVELGRVAGALEQVRAQLMKMTRGSESAISSLAREVDADKLTVAGLEAEARRRGCPLKLTREELLERYAELNQEIIQPLTVSTGVIEMLRKEQAGEVSDCQHELLRMAHDSIERVNQLVEYMHAVSGLPENYSPDEGLINDSYSVRNVE